MNEYLLLKFLHIVAFVYWLGGDLGTFLASRQVVNTDNSAASRHVALKIMLACDMGPKLAMPLIFPLGLHLSYLLGAADIPVSALIVTWVLCLYWFAVVLIIYRNEGKTIASTLGALDFYFRIAVVVLLLGYSGYALAGLAGAADWVIWKIIVFAALVSCGLAIRLNLKPFMPAFAEMMSAGANEHNNIAMEQSIARCRPYVWCIWAGLFINAALGTRLLGG
jgi:hypothetical protein